MSNTFTKGSEWRKWDLHGHSPLSILNNRLPKLGNGEPDWEPFLQKNGFMMFGTTMKQLLQNTKTVKCFER